MKNFMKTGFSMCVAAFLGLSALVAPAKAITLDDVSMSRLDAKSYWIQADVSSTTFSNVAMLLTYKGTASEAVVAITVSGISAEAPDGTADTGFGATGMGGAYDFTASTSNTLGELCDAINTTADYGCVLIGGARDDSPLLLRDQSSTSGTNDLKAAGGFRVTFSDGASPDTSALAKMLSVGAVPSPGKRIIARKCEWNINGIASDRIEVRGQAVQNEPPLGGLTGTPLGVSSAKAAAFIPYAWNDTVKVWTDTIGTDDTSASKDWSSASGIDGMGFAQNAHVVLRAVSASAQAPTNFMRCLVEER